MAARGGKKRPSLRSSTDGKLAIWLQKAQEIHRQRDPRIYGCEWSRCLKGDVENIIDFFQGGVVHVCSI